MKILSSLLNKKKIFVGADFSELQIIWLINIISSYSKKNNIEIIIFEYPLHNQITQNENFKEIVRNYEVIYLNEILPFWFNFKFLKLIYFLFNSLYISLFVKLIKNNKKIDWKTKNLFCGVWDFAYRNSKNKLYPNLYELFISSFHFLQKKYKANFLKYFSVNAAFLGHSVYHAKAFLLVFRENNIDIYCNSWCLYHQKKHSDVLWDFPSKKFFSDGVKFININKVNKYWHNRQNGKGKYKDSNLASRKIDFNKKYEKFNNVLMLHIFRDTPNHVIDNNKIFINYIDWIYETLIIISKSNEKWLIRMHPSYKIWGEDQPLILNKIIRKVSKNYCLKNILIDDSKRSNVEIFKYAKRIVTYSGTAAIESVCNGLKPITISKTLLYEYNNSFVFKPKSLAEYEKLLLKDSNFNIFQVNNNLIQTAKFFIFIRENYLNLISDLNIEDFRKSESIGVFDNKKLYLQYCSILNKNKKYLIKLGELLGNKLTHTVSKNYLKNIKT